MKKAASRNNTITLTAQERTRYRKELITLTKNARVEDVLNRVIYQDTITALPYLPEGFVDLLIVDPPYNMGKQFGSKRFKEMNDDAYEAWVERWFAPLMRTLKKTASAYVCGEWRSSSALYRVLQRHTTVRNRITWEREKGRGAAKNWKNASEDIWFATVSNDYYFDVDAVKVKRKVIAPYRDEQGRPKDWENAEEGAYRLTYPSNVFDDLTVPFWSMRENTPHPTQKPEKLLAKLILASSQPGAVVFDPFLGSGTTAVAAKKLGRRYLGIEREEEYALYALKRLHRADSDSAIQGYDGRAFLARNMPSG